MNTTHTATHVVDADSADHYFLLVMAVLVFLMQAGFAFLEAGSVRAMNTTNILTKNMLDAMFGCISYWLFGYALAFGERGNPFCGGWNFALSHMSGHKFAFFFFQYVFAATATTIVSGAVAERCEFVAYVIYSFLISGFVYPIVSHWAWDPKGWLLVGIKTNVTGTVLASTYMDFAGSGVLHVVGGAAAFVGALFLGPRIGRFSLEGRIPINIPGHSVPLAFLGGFLLFFGFFAFNGESQLTISNEGDGDVVALAMINTIISASFGTTVTLLSEKFIFKRNWSLLVTLNGALAAMVAICAGCNTVYPWGAAIIGFFAAISFMTWSRIVLALKIDDPLDAVAVHFGGGIWGVIAVPFLHKDRGILFKWDQQSGLDLGWQIAGLLAIIVWTAGLSIVIFGLLKVTKIFRVPEETELRGLDILKHGEPAYPEMAFGHGLKEEVQTANHNEPAAEINKTSHDECA